MSRDLIITKAKTELGNSENPANSNKTKYGKWYGMDGHAWCAMFVSWVFDQAGLRLQVGQTAKGYHHCQSAHNIWKQKKRLTTSPRKGDIVLFDWQGDGWADHTGIFVKWVDDNHNQFICIEGNTSESNNSNGGLVMERTRRRNHVKAFVSPEVFDDGIAQPNKSFKVGDYGSDVVEIQKMLNHLGYPILADGWFGQQTAKQVLAFQTDNLMPQTGEVDTGTLGALQEEFNRKRVAKSKLTTGSYFSYGDAGIWISEIQKALNEANADPQLVVNGRFGKNTVIALKKFQKSRGLKVDGIAGPQTLRALKLV